MHLNIKPLNDISKDFYVNHGHFHSGDAGLDLYVIEETYESSAHVLVEATSEKEAKQKYENGDTYEQVSAEGDSVLTSSKVFGLAVNHAPHHYKDYVKSKNKDDK